MPREIERSAAASSRRRSWLPTCAAALTLLLGGVAKPARADVPAVEKKPSVDLDALIARAKRENLAHSPHWLRLLHYRQGMFGGFSSEADGKPFFLAAEGKSEPAAELEATLRALFSAGPDEQANGLQHPYCRFPARRRFLERALGLSAVLPQRACARYVAFLGSLRPDGVTLIFSSYYLNNPASAFGHTFLRIEKGGRPSDGEPTDLLDHGVDFSATVDTSNALLYAIKGLSGLFPGEFRKVPYYNKVREYNDFESRDLWEYELSLTSDEVAYVAAHLWELGATYFAYYYLSENCSYHVLGLLESASPRLRLLEHLRWPVIPADTVKALYKNAGLVRRVHYRPSNRTQLGNRLSALDSTERDFLARLLASPNIPFPATMPAARQVKVLDTALDLIDVRLARELVKERSELDPEADVQQALLLRRSEYELETAPDLTVPPFRRMPQFGHGSRRLGLGGGYLRGQGPYQLLRFRLALHDLADPSRGYPDGASIEFLPVSLRYREKTHTFTLEEFELVRVQSVSPWTRFERPLSFRVGVGMTRSYDSGCVDCATGLADIGFGLSLAPFTDALLLYALAEARLFAPFRSGLFDAVRIGAGPLTGLRVRFSDDLALLATGRFTYLPAQDPSYVWAADGALRWQYFPNFAFGVEGTLMPKGAWVQGLSYIYF